MAIDAITGEIDEAPQTPLDRERVRVQVLESDLQLAEAEIRELRRSNAALKAQLNRRMLEGSHEKVAKAVAEYYRQRLKKTQGWKFGPKRLKVVVDRLKEGYDGLYIARAIDGAVVGAYTNPQTGVRYDDLELVCRDEVKLERFHQIAEANQAMTMVNESWTALLRGQDPNLLPKDDDIPVPASEETSVF